MTAVERSVVLAASADDVWTVLSDFGAISRWAPNVDHSCVMSKQISGVGAVRRIQADRTTVLETIEIWEPGSTLSYRVTGLPPIIKSVTNAWRLEADGVRTRVLLATDVDAGSRPPQVLIAKAFGKRLASISDQMLDGLARHLETTSTTGATS